MRAQIWSLRSVGLLALAAGCSEHRLTSAAFLQTERANTRPTSTHTTVVTPGAQGGWMVMAINPAMNKATYAGYAGREAGLSRPSSVVGRGIRLHVGTGPVDGALVRTVQFARTPLSELTALGFSTFIADRGSDAATPLLTIGIDLNGDDYVDDHLLFRPTPALGRWEKWDALRGGWQSLSGIGSPDARGIRTLAAYLSDKPQARLMSAITIGAWRASGDRPLVADVDQVVIGVGGKTTVFQFGAIRPRH